jgi:20S proteasome subunit beta 5
MICGWDKTGPTIFYVDSDGNRLKGDAFCVGSGQTFAYGVLDSGLRHDLTVDEALALGRRAILAAAHRDAFSGGSINCTFSFCLRGANLVYHVTQDGWRYIGNEDVADLIWATKKSEGGFSMIPS